MEYNKSYKGLALWLAGYLAACCAPLLLKVDGPLATRLVLVITAVAMPLLCLMMLRHESVYWINGVSFEEARGAGSERRRAFAMAHLRTFSWFALGYGAFTVVTQALGASIAIDTVVFCVGIIAAALSTLRIRL